MEILMFMFDDLISNNKENKNDASPPPGTPLTKKIFFSFFLEAI